VATVDDAVDMESFEARLDLRVAAQTVPFPVIETGGTRRGASDELGGVRHRHAGADGERQVDVPLRPEESTSRAGRGLDALHPRRGLAAGTGGDVQCAGQ